jgi:hypothetical protein
MFSTNWSDKKIAFAATLLLLILTVVFMGQALFPPANQALGSHDTRGLFIPWFSFIGDSLREGRLPFWDDTQFAGYPFLSNPQVAFFYPPTWLALLLPLNFGISWHVALHIWLAAVGMLFYVRFMGGRWFGAFLAAITFAFGGTIVARMWAGHIGLIATNAWLPWLLLATAWAVRRGGGWTAVIAGLPFALAILAGHTASLLYIALIWLAFALYLALTTGRWLLVGRQVAIAGLVGLALSSVQLLPFIELSRLSGRAAEPSFDFASAYSLPLNQLLTLLVPDYFGEPAQIGYWGALTFEELTFYAGLLPLLAVFIALRRPSRLAGLYLLLILLGLLLSLGNNGFLYEVFYDLFPPFRLARAPGRASILFVFAVAGLIGEIISRWERQPKEVQRKVLRPWLIAGFILLAILGALALWQLNSGLAGQEGTDTGNRLAYQIRGTSWALALALIGLVLLGLYLAAPTKLKTGRLVIAGLLVALVLVDLWSFGLKLKQLNPATPHPMWPQAGEIIGQNQARVLPWGVSIFEQNGAGQVGLWSVFGYNALELEAPIALAASLPDPRSKAYDVLGIGHVLANHSQDQYLEGERPLKPLDNTDQVWVYERDQILPLTRLVRKAEIIENRESAYQRLHDPAFDPEIAVILDRPPPCDLSSEQAVGGSVGILEQRPGYWQLATNSPSPALLVLSQASYPGWRVTVDDQPAEPLLAYTALQAVCVPAGEHLVTWNYRPTLFLVGGVISLGALILLGFAIVFVRKKAGKDQG